MKDPRGIIASILSPSIGLGVLLAFISVFSITAIAQNNYPIPQGSLIIAMDNERQGSAGNCNGPQFNLRAYGYAVRLLHQNVKLAWVINNAKTLNTQNDITGINVSQLSTGTYGGQTCEYSGGAPVNFRGGPLVITPEFADTAKSLLASYNGSTSANDDIRVYEVQSASFTVPVANVLELTHKPFVAVGPDCTPGGDCFSENVYERLYAAAGLQANIHYVPVSNNTFSNYCVTLAAQAHAQTSGSDPATNYLAAYRTHVNNGGNLLLQCASVEVFEDNSINGRYFTTGGITDNAGVTSTPVPTTFNPQLPFNQYVGSLGNATGWTRFSGASYRPETVFAARQTSDSSSAAVAFVRDMPGAAGLVMGLGGHEYGGYTNDGIGSSGGPDVSNGAYERVNGSRMALNALLIPAQPACSFTPPTLKGYKTVRLGTAVGDDANNNGIINLQDNVEWTVRYINTGATEIANFQITDTIDNRLTFQAGTLSASVQASSVASPVSVTVNNSYNGTSNLTMLSPSITLDPGAMVTVKFKTKVIVAADIPNQASATGNGVQTPVATDSADGTTPGSESGYLIASDCANAPACYDQSPWVPGTDPNEQWTAAIEPTYISLTTVVTAAGAEVSGRVQDSNGRALAREVITLQSATTGESQTVMTNTFGYFRFADVQVGDFYVMSIKSRRYTYAVPSITFSLQDNLLGAQFTASRPGTPDNSPSADPAPKTQVTESAAPSGPVKTAPVKAVPAQRRTIVLSPVKKKALKDDEEESDKDL